MGKKNLFYKATRPDGSSFHKGPDGVPVLYEVGYTYYVPKAERVGGLCTSGVIHASDTPSETLIGGSWPCKLFEVTGNPIGKEGHKFGFYEFTVEREIESWRALGPNGKEVAAFIEALKGVSPAALNAARRAARRAAWDAARRAAWDAAWDAAWYAARAAARAAALSAAWDAARRAGAAGGAAWGLTSRDLITDAQFNALYKPWESLIPLDSLGPWKSLKKRKGD